MQHLSTGHDDAKRPVTFREIRSQRVEAEDRVIQDVRNTLSALAGNADNTRRLLDGFHV